MISIVIVSSTAILLLYMFIREEVHLSPAQR